MVAPSAGSTVAFVCIVLALAILFVVGVERAGRALGDPPDRRRRAVLAAAVGMIGWLAITGWMSGSGVLEAPGMPPRAMIFFVGVNATALVVACTRVGTKMIDGLPIAALVGVQAFRLPLELVLHQWYAEGVLPVQMTYEGDNFDIVTGILALVVGLLVWTRGPSRMLVLGFNLVGAALLLRVMSIAVLSVPTPLRTYWNDPPVLLAFHFPYGWIVPICVAGALFGHVLVFRWLWRDRSLTSAGRSSFR